MLSTILSSSDNQLSSNMIIGISLLVIGIVFSALFVFLTFWQKNKQKHSSFGTYNRPSEDGIAGIWNFTKKNFFIFVAFVFGIIAFVGLMMIIQV